MHNILDTEPDQLTYGSLNKRVIAYLIDQIVIVFIGGFPWFVLGAIETMDRTKYVSAELALLLTIAIVWIYEAGMHSSSYQATLGKMALGLRVTDLEGNRISFARATGRFFGKILPVGYIGYFLANFTKKRQALHDMIAGTLVLGD